MIVTGSRGFIGQRAIMQLNAEPFPSELLYQDFSTDAARERIKAYIATQNEKVLIHTAAISDIGTCEKAPEDSYQANVLLPLALAEAAVTCGIKLICFSSDQVYTGMTSNGPYTENDTLPPPANVYARHKLEAEKRVLDRVPDAVMLRATWMYDMPLYGHPNRGNFLVNSLRSIRNEEPIVVHHQHRAITYARQVVSLLPDAARLPGGIYNYGSENTLDMEETARALLDAFHLKGSIVCTGERRHPLWMDCTKLKAHGILFDTTAEGFYRCAADYGLN